MRAGCGGGGRSPPSQEARKREDARAGPGSSPQRTGEAAGLPSAPPPPPSPPLSPGRPPHPCAAGTRGPPVPAPLGRGPPPARRPPAPSPAAAAASRPGAAPRARRLCQSPPSSPSEAENQPGCEASPPGPVGTWQSKGGGHDGCAGQRVERGRAQESQSGCGGSRLLPAAAMAVPSPQPRPPWPCPPPPPALPAARRSAGAGDAAPRGEKGNVRLLNAEMSEERVRGAGGLSPPGGRRAGRQEGAGGETRWSSGRVCV